MKRSLIAALAMFSFGMAHADVSSPNQDEIGKCIRSFDEKAAQDIKNPYYRNVTYRTGQEAEDCFKPIAKHDARVWAVRDKCIKVFNVVSAHSETIGYAALGQCMVEFSRDLAEDSGRN